MGQTWNDADDVDDRLTTGPFGGGTPLPPSPGSTVPTPGQPQPAGGHGNARQGGRGGRPRDPNGSTLSSASSSGDRPPSGPPEAGHVWLGKYDVLRKLGQGAMGEVWLVRHLELGIERALKLISLSAQYDPEMRARFRREARAMALFSHVNAVTVHDASTASDTAYIEMEYVVGRSLDKVLERGVPMPLDWTERIIVQLCDVLQEAHRSGIVHRDIKPSNMMLVDGRPEGREFLKVLDFGIAKILDAQKRDVDDLQTRQGATMGTLAYMSPEQVNGDSEKIDGRSDLYSVGVLMYELLTGSRPFTSPGFRLSYDHLFTLPPPFATTNPEVRVPPVVEGLVLRCLEKDPALRPQSARELADAFRNAAAPPAPKAVMVSEAPPPTRRSVLIAGIVAASGAGGLATWIATLRTPAQVQNPPPRSPMRVVLEAGKAANFSIPIPPGESNATYKIDLGDLPNGIQVKRLEDEPSGEVAAFQVEADLNADHTLKRTLTFHMIAGDETRTEVVEVSILKPQVAPLPRGFIALPESRLQFVRRDVYPTHIVRVLPDGDQVGFRLVPKGRSGGPDDFYIMQDKVSIRLYKKFAAEQSVLSEANLGERTDDRLPMMGVNVQEAYDFARWLGGTGLRDDSSTAQTSHEERIRAHLPTTTQWDKAAGFFDRGGRKGPYLMTWSGLKGEIAVGRSEEEGPMPVGTATHDISWCGCRDMAGNGPEWTRNAAVSGDPFPFPPGDPRQVELRGQRYDSDKPLTFAEMEIKNFGAQFCDFRDSGISFRIVLDSL